MKKLVFIFCSLIALSSCGKDVDASLESMESHEETTGIMEPSAADTFAQSSEEVDTQKIEQQIIKTGTLRYEVSDLDAERSKIISALKSTEGYIQNDNTGKTYNEHYQNLTLRVPTRNFQQLIDVLSKGVAYFDEKTISRQDVTEEFVDLNARLNAKRELETRYLDILEKANSVKEILEIERELATIREEIEAKEGRLNYLKSQVSISTINLYFYRSVADTGITTSYGSKLVNALQGGWNAISAFVLGIVYIWPFLIIAILGLFFFRRWRKRNRKI